MLAQLNNSLLIRLYTQYKSSVPYLTKNIINPLKNESLEIGCLLTQKEHVLIKIFTLSGGAEIITLVDQDISQGRYAVEWFGKTINGDTVGNGIYIVFIQLGTDRFIKKVAVVKQ